MILFLAALLLLGAMIWRFLQPKGSVGWVTFLVLALPLLYASSVLVTGFQRLDSLELRYVGKRVAWGTELPLTGGGSDPNSAIAEDLYSSTLSPDCLRFEPTTEEDHPGTPILALSGVAPAVLVNGRVLNAVALEDGDVLAIDLEAEEDQSIEFRQDALHREETSKSLPGFWERALRPARVQLLRDLFDHLPSDRIWSYLDHLDGQWHVVLRDEHVRVLRGGKAVGSLTTRHPLPKAFDLRLQVLRGNVDARSLRTVRNDRILFDREYAEIRFGEPERRRIPLEGVERPLERGLVVPSSSDRRTELIEFQEHSPRFHGLSATLRFEPDTGTASLEYLGGAWEAQPDDLYGLGEGNDLMLLRLERTRFPTQILLDLALLALFLGIFLGPSLAKSPALTAVVGVVGLLLADRLLFAYRAATQPPDFYLRGYAEARLALWIVPALLLFGWTVGVILRRVKATDPEKAPGWRSSLARAFRILRWPVAGLVIAGAGWWLTGRGADRDLRILTLLPWLLALLLPILYVILVGPLATRATRWQRDGWRWPLWGAAAFGGVWLLLRLGFSALGMPEALRLPGGFRLLWTVLQLPFAALVVGLSCHAALRARGRPWAWLGGIASVAVFLILAFAGVGAFVRDTGLLLVHGLAIVFALALLLIHPRRILESTEGWKPKAVYAVGVLIVVAPLLLFVCANLMPQRMVQLADWLRPAQATAELVGEETQDPAVRMRGTTQQQLFRLYMLANPDRLRDVGLKPAERVAVQYETLRAYAASAGLAGKGFHSSKLPRHLGVTYLNDLMPMSFVLADFGKLGMLGLALTYLTILLAAIAAFRAAADHLGRQGAWIATAALLAFALPGIYMILANLNLVLFTGKNSTLLALNSVSDVLESGALLCVTGFGLALTRFGS